MKKERLSFSMCLKPLCALCIVFFLIPGCEKTTETVSDIDGNVYKTVKIGTQVWMSENLRVTKFRNGEPIPNISDPVEWRLLSVSAYCNYTNDSAYVASYGRLYNWFSVNDIRNIAPEGWHVPGPEEVKVLCDYLGGDDVAGGKMKETGNMHWLAPNTGATNESGFNAIPGGYRFTNDSTHHPIGGTFHSLGSNAFWWSATESYQIYSWSGFVHVRFADIIRDFTHKTYGFSVRCVKD